MELATNLNGVVESLGLSDNSVTFLSFAVPTVAAFVAWIFRVPIGKLLGKIFHRSKLSTKPKLGIFLRDRDFVGAYNRKFTQYVSIAKDENIANSLAEWGGAILLGRGGIGKSQAACEHIRRYSRSEIRSFPPRIWHVVCPNRQDLKPEDSHSFFRRRLILFFDDINEFLAGGEISQFYAYLEHHRQKAKELKLVCTCRSTTPEVEALEPVLKLFSRLREIPLPDWTEDQRLELANRTGVNESEWDGTPLSAKMPSTEMRQRYLRLDDEGKQVIQIFKRLDRIGMNFGKETFLADVFAGLDPIPDLGKSLKILKGLGFFKRSEDEYEVYKPYLEFVDQPRSVLRDAVNKALVATDSRSLLYRAASTLVNLGDLRDARQLLEADLAANGEFAPTYYWLGVIERRSAEWKKAVEAFEKASTINPQDPATWQQLVGLYEKLGEVGLAATAKAHVASTMRRQTPGGLLALALQEVADGRDEAALEAIEQALELDETITKGWGLRGQILLRLNRNEEAEKVLKIAESRDPDAFVYYGLAQAQRNLRKWEDALDSVSKSISCDPEQAQAWSLQGQCQNELGCLGDARDSFHEAIRLGAGAPAHFGLGMTYRKLKDAKGMAAEFSMVVELQKSNALAWSYLGDAHSYLHEEERAIEAYQNGVKFGKGRATFEIAFANGLGRLGWIKEAVDKLQTIIDEDPTHAPAQNSLTYWTGKL